MNKTSNKLAAGVRKLKRKHESAVPGARDADVSTPARVPPPQPAPLPLHPERIWPD